MAEGAVMSSAPNGITVQIIHTSAGDLPTHEAPLIQALYHDEPVAAQTLLDIAQPGLVSEDQVLTRAFSFFH